MVPFIENKGGMELSNNLKVNLCKFYILSDDIRAVE